MDRDGGKIRVVDLFSGAGGLSLGFDGQFANFCNDQRDRNLQFKHCLAVEKNDAARATYERNFDGTDTRGDITDIDSFARWGDADVVIGGPPCQGFSRLNKKRDEYGEMNQLWVEFIRAVEEIDPAVFLMENVAPFYESPQADAVRDRAQSLGYQVRIEKICAEEYGVPQSRTRTFVLGSRIGRLEFPAPTTPDNPPSVREAISDLPAEPTGEDWHVGRNVRGQTKRRIEQVPPGGDRRDIDADLLPECWQGDDVGFTDVYGRLRWDDPSVTIRTSFINPSKGRYLHPSEDRAITPREGARLQTFPDDFEFATGTKGEVTNQIGNAVPPKLGYELAVAIQAHFDDKTHQGGESDRIALRAQAVSRYN